MTLTTQSTYDVLVLQRQGNTVGGYYKTTISDYYMSSARRQAYDDTINNMDRDVTSYNDGNYYESQLYRTKGNTQGEDWQGGDFVNICFYTSDTDFVQTKFTGLS